MNIKWQDGAPAPVKDGYHTAVLCDGKVYIGGGYGSPNKIDIYTPASNLWSSSSINTPYKCFAITTLNNQLITAGGKDISNKVTNKVFSLVGDHLKEFTTMITLRCYATAAGCQKTLIITGGRDDHNRILDSTELFDSITGQWYNAGKLPSPHYGLQSVIVDNVVYLLRGTNLQNKYSNKVFSAQLDTLSSHQLKWSSQQDTPANSSTPVSIQGRHLLTVGGMKGGVITRDIHMFNKTGHKWEVIGQIPSARDGPAAVSVSDHKIVVVGGRDDKYYCTNTVWISSSDPL